MKQPTLKELQNMFDRVENGTPKMHIIEAPVWLKNAMEKLKHLPKPTIAQVETQFKASAKYRKENL